MSKSVINKEHLKISVIIPAYNAQLKIVRAIDYVLAQSQPGIELIVADDGSVDKTAEIVKWYVEKYQNVRLFQK